MYKLLKFNKEYYEPIRNGTKTQTLRKSNKKLKEGDIVRPVFQNMMTDWSLQITNTGYKQFKYLDKDDAKREGYDNLEDLKKDLLKIYPRLDDFDRLYYYQFKVVDKDGNEEESP